VQETFRFGRVAGIPVGMNWSVLIIAWLLAFGLATQALPELVPDQPAGLYWLVGGTAAAGFFGSLLAHELAHALVARRHGVPVEGITLWVLGGVSRLGADTPDADAELRIAAVGPATSLGIGAVGLVVTGALGVLGVPELIVAALGWLAGINLVLGVFNLAPAFPLDGGRILRALLWRHHGDRLRATGTAATAGRVFGYLLVGLGVLVFSSGALVSGLWFMALGWFVLIAARGEQVRVEQQELLDHVAVRQVMTRDPVCAPAELDVATFLEHYVLRQRWSSYPIVDAAGRVVGLVTLERLRQVDPAARHAARLVDVAFPLEEVPVAAPGDPLEPLVVRLAGSRAGRALVFDAGRLVGLVSRTDVARFLERRALARPRP
jgi:Zn-dependent protease/CBS domain-containing protein